MEKVRTNFVQDNGAHVSANGGYGIICKRLNPNPKGPGHHITSLGYQGGGKSRHVPQLGEENMIAIYSKSITWDVGHILQIHHITSPAELCARWYGYSIINCGMGHHSSYQLPTTQHAICRIKHNISKSPSTFLTRGK